MNTTLIDGLNQDNTEIKWKSDPDPRIPDSLVKKIKFKIKA